MRISKVASSAQYIIDEQFENCPYFSQILVLQIEKILEICWFSNSDNFKFRKFPEFPTRKIQKNFKTFQFLKSSTFFNYSISKNSKFPLINPKIPKIFNLENSKSLEFVKFQKCSTSKFKKILSWKIPEISN